MVDIRGLLKDCRAQLAAGDARDAMLRVRDAIRRNQLGPEQLERAGRLIARHLEQRGDTATRVLLLGQCTTSWLVPALTAVAWGDRRPLDVVDADYDNIVQELAKASDLSSQVVVLLPWNRDLIAPSEPVGDERDERIEQRIEERVDDAMGTWRLAWSLLAERGAPRLIQVGYDWVSRGALGGHLGAISGDLALIRAMNDRLRSELPPEAVFVDLAEISGQMGRESFYDPRRYHWTRQPFSEQGAVRVAEHLCAAIRAATTGPRKVLVLDLDDTLWGGVVGELGPLGIALGESPEGEAFRDFQLEVAKLARRGIVLAVASKNNPDDAAEPFEKNPDMALSLDDFAAFEACWDPKDAMLRHIALQLRLGLEDFVFFDDNPAERELIRQALPEVTVVDVPEDPAEYVRALERGLYFEARSLTDADRTRTVQYKTERKRRALQTSAPSLDGYLDSLEMRGAVEVVDDTSMQRVVQLLGKTNQWNLTTRRLSEAELRAHLEAPGSIGLTLRMVDRFGDYGLISLILAERAGDVLRITDWLMSCRVIDRTAEHFLFGELLARARNAGVLTLEAEYRPTRKNSMVAELYPELGFAITSEKGDDERTTYRLSLAESKTPKTSVQAE